MNKITVTGKTVEEAVQAGLAQLNVTQDKVKVDIIEQPNKGLFGLIGSKEAKVELEVIPDQLDNAEQFLQSVLSEMNLTDAEIIREQEDGLTKFNINGSEMGLVIGRRGQTLDSLQFLVNIVGNKDSNRHIKIILDAENFRERRRKTLEDLSERLANKVIRSRREVVLEPMSPLERKVIHTKLQDHARVRTYSKGEEPNRRVVIALK